MNIFGKQAVTSQSLGKGDTCRRFADGRLQTNPVRFAIESLVGAARKLELETPAPREKVHRFVHERMVKGKEYLC